MEASSSRFPLRVSGGSRVITMDYRMAPEHKYPAAEDDIVAVYRELLKTYRPENIGIYGCSAGAVLTGTTVAKLIATGQPKPGAIGMFGQGIVGSHKLGDSNYFFSAGKPTWDDAFDSYSGGVNMRG